MQASNVAVPLSPEAPVAVAQRWRVPLFDVAFDEQEIFAVNQVLRSGWLTMGPKTQQLEQAFAQMLGVGHALAVTNGTAALHLAHLALGLGPGDEVITTPFTFVATSNSIVITGATPVFADILGPHDLNISPKEIEKRITSRTKAITVVHYAGSPCRMDEIADIARRRGLALIEDCAHAPGAFYCGHALGAWGDIGCFSLYSNKNLTTGEGGMVTTNDPALANRLRLLRSHGMTASAMERHRGEASTYDVQGVGCNYRIDEMRSSLGLCQLTKLASRNRRRQDIDKVYRRLLGDDERLTLPFSAGGDSVCHIFPVLLDERVSREAFRRAMHRQGIQTSIHYPPVHLFSWYRDNLPQYPGTLPKAERAGARQVTLPLYPAMGLKEISQVVEAVHNSLEEAWT